MYQAVKSQVEFLVDLAALAVQEAQVALEVLAVPAVLEVLVS